MGAIYFNLMEGLAAMEQALIKERTLVGLNNARKNGKIGGRPKSIKTIKKFASFITIKRDDSIHLHKMRCFCRNLL